ncbi:hypothetical protein EMIHUDRAFT_361550, partial [Emiliania huxleyi CCMP1516]|uniref:Uncharacterized protein n=2 Tax=Emiliania huxleyi TaxID=2903 RepID=A0A0D3KSK9_EMIH1
MWASGPATAARPVEAGLGPARDGWPPTSALALLVKMAAVAIAATKVQAYSAQASGVCRLLSHTATRVAPRGHEPSAIRSRSQKLLARTAADSAIAAAAVELSRRLVPQSEITREQLSLPLASPPSPPGIRGTWHPMGRPEYRPLACQPPMKYSDRHLAGLSAITPDRVELIGAGSLGYGTGPSF